MASSSSSKSRALLASAAAVAARHRLLPVVASSSCRPPSFWIRHLTTSTTPSSATTILRPTVRDVLRGLAPIDSEVEITAWVRSTRTQKQHVFLELNDGTCPGNLQVVWAHTLLSSSSSSAASSSTQPSSLSTGASVRVRGRLVKSPKPAQPVELLAEGPGSGVDVLGPADSASYPLQKKGHTREFLRDIAHLRARGALGAATLRVRSSLAWGIHSFFRSRGFVQVNTPLLTSNDCEGAGELFAVEPASSSAAAAAATTPHPAASSAQLPSAPSQHHHFFGKPVYLTVSGQLHLEAFALALGKTYTFGPTFRAENSNTPRHLAEFWMLEPEVAPASMDDAIELAQGCVKAACSQILADLPEDVAFFAKHLDACVPQRLASVADPLKPFARITYTEAIDMLKKAQASGKKWKFQPKWEDGLAHEHEMYLASEMFQGPVFVTEYPAAIKAFYARSSSSSYSAGDAATPGPTVQAFDLLVPGVGELVGGSAREHRYDVLAQRMRSLGLLSPATAERVGSNPDMGLTGGSPADLTSATLDWYLDLRKYGSVPHAGWGLGFERLVLFVTGLDNVRDAVPVPRVPGSCRM